LQTIFHCHIRFWNAWLTKLLIFIFLTVENDLHVHSQYTKYSFMHTVGFYSALYILHLHRILSPLSLALYPPSHYCFWPSCTKCIWLIHVSRAGGPLLIRYLLCVIKSSHTFWLTFFKPCTVVMDALMMCMWRFGSTRDGHFSKNLHIVELSHFSSIIAGGRLIIGYILCVINSLHTFRLTLFKPCTIAMDTLEICMWLFESIRTFFEKFPCRWT
jgi:hypothetical protein